MEKKIFEAMYHLRKEQAIQFYNLNPEKSLYSRSAIYALANDCFPYFSPKCAEFEEFDGFFRVKKEFVAQVWDYICSESEENRFHTYYDLETRFGRKACRIEMLTTLRYAFLAGRLDCDVFWEKLLEKSGFPIEAKHLNKPFDPSELFLLKY